MREEFDLAVVSKKILDLTHLRILLVCFFLILLPFKTTQSNSNSWYVNTVDSVIYNDAESPRATTVRIDLVDSLLED